MKKAVAKAKPASKPVAKKAVAAKRTPHAVKKTTAKAVAGPRVNVVKGAPPKAPPVARKARIATTAPAPAAHPVPVVAPVAAPAEPVTRASRASRLALITVPSLPPSVASTAAKSSFIQNMSTTTLAPPPPVTIKKDPKLANNWKTKPIEDLCDEEIIAMPDAEYMNETQMAFFRLKLQRLKQDILENADETTEHLREDTIVVPDPADRATIEEEHALELRTRDRERKLLKKIEQSIARIDGGDYGYCDETGEPIGVGRLIARPTATLSLEAQQRRELKQKMFGD